MLSLLSKRNLFIFIFNVVVNFAVLAGGKSDYSGTLVVVNKRADNVSFIDLATKQIVKTLPTGKGSHELAMTKDGLWAVSTDYVGGNSLTVFDVKKAKVVRTIDLSKFPNPHGILFLKDQTHVAISSEGSDSVVIANIHTGKVTSNIGTTQRGSHMVALPADSSVVYTTNMRDNTVSQLDVQSAKLLKLMPMEGTPEAITVNKGNTELWVGSNKDGLVSVYDVASNKLLKQWKDYTWPYRILLNQAETYALAPDLRRHKLDIYNAKTKSRIKTVQFDDGDGPKGVIFHPDDSTAFLSMYEQDKVLAIDVPSGEILFELPTGDGPDGIGYSPHVVTF
ncbi:YncE family protein [Alteromonadaceae bacterium M269]|nr:YncE family protein [Alteromonadaceae bacterium M269]